MRSQAQIRRGVFAIWLSAAILSLVCHRLGLLRDIENGTWDMRQRLVAEPAAHDPKIKIIMIDQSSIDHFARREKIFWPWPRSLYNPVLLFLEKAGARGVAFDMLFTESSTHVGDDEEFARVVSSSIPVVSAMALLRGHIDSDPEIVKLFDQVQGARKDALEPYLQPGMARAYKGATYPIEQLISKSPALGNVTAEADSDKIFRRTSVGGYLHDVPVLNLPFALYELTHPGALNPESLRQLSDDHGSLLIRFFGQAATYDTYSIAAVINSWVKIEEGREPDISLDDFKDAYVFIGTNAPGLLDLRPVPLAGNYPGVELNATVFDNVVHGGFLRQVPEWLSLLASVVFLALVAMASMRITRYQTLLIAGAVLAWSSVALACASYGLWLPLVVPLLGAIYSLLLIFLLQYRIEGREHRFIRGAFQHYVTPEVINQIVRDPSSLSLGGDRRELTILFSDIQGFTSISERMAPVQLVAFLNRFLSEMTDILLVSEGTIDKYEGDAIIAFWNAPLGVPDHERRAVQAALRCQMRLEQLQDSFLRDFGVSVRMRIGLHTGTVTVGNFGSSTRFNYTVIGDAANLASRLEGVNKVFGTRVLVSGDTRKRAGEEFPWRQVGKVRVVGRSEPVQLFQPLHPQLDAAIISRLGEYERARALFEEGKLAEADAIFAVFPDDTVCRAYRDRIKFFGTSGEAFSSIWNLTEK